MTAATLAAPRRPAPIQQPRPRGPRLLLPPATDPPRTPRPASSGPGTFLPPALRSARSAVTESAWPAGIPTGPRPTPQLPEPATVCGPVVLAAVEALRGARPLAQLLRWVSPEIYETLGARVQTATAGPRPRARIRRSHVCRLSPTAAEASVVVHDGTRVRAAAIRLEVHRGHWRATVLQIG